VTSRESLKLRFEITIFVYKTYNLSDARIRIAIESERRIAPTSIASAKLCKCGVRIATRPQLAQLSRHSRADRRQDTTRLLRDISSQTPRDDVWILSP